MLSAATLAITPEILKIISEIDEFKGAWKALSTLSPERLSALRRVATIESVGSSTRIEGSTLTDREVEYLLSNIDVAEFSSRDDQEVISYAETMDLIFTAWRDIPVNEASIRQLHRELLAHSTKDEWYRGQYKTTANNISAFDSQGHQVGIVLQTASPFETPYRMEELVQWLERETEVAVFHPLLLIGIFNAVFLEIHPFQDGNGRLSRILTNLLLLRAGYTYVPYTSLESVIEQSKEQYYRSLRLSQRTIRSDAPDWHPWLMFFLHAMQQQAARLKIKIERERLISRPLSLTQQQIIEHIRDHRRATISELEYVTSANRNTLKKQVRGLVDEGRLRLVGRGRGAAYVLATPDHT